MSQTIQNAQRRVTCRLFLFTFCFLTSAQTVPRSGPMIPETLADSLFLTGVQLSAFACRDDTEPVYMYFLCAFGFQADCPELCVRDSSDPCGSIHDGSEPRGSIREGPLHDETYSWIDGFGQRPSQCWPHIFRHRSIRFRESLVDRSFWRLKVPNLGLVINLLDRSSKIPL